MGCKTHQRPGEGAMEHVGTPTVRSLRAGWWLGAPPTHCRVFQPLVLSPGGPKQPPASRFDLNSCLEFRHLLETTAKGAHTGGCSAWSVSNAAVWPGGRPGKSPGHTRCACQLLAR